MKQWMTIKKYWNDALNGWQKQTKPLKAAHLLKESEEATPGCKLMTTRKSSRLLLHPLDVNTEIGLQGKVKRQWSNWSGISAPNTTPLFFTDETIKRAKNQAGHSQSAWMVKLSPRALCSWHHYIQYADWDQNIGGPEIQEQRIRKASS